MKMCEITKAVMKEKKITQKAIAPVVGVKQTAVSNLLLSDPMSVKERVKLLDYLGYEVIVREKRQGRRAEGEYVVTFGEGDAREKKEIEESEERARREEAERKTSKATNKVVGAIKGFDLEESKRILREALAACEGGKSE